jgi:hypothetical protein
MFRFVGWFLLIALVFSFLGIPPVVVTVSVVLVCLSLLGGFVLERVDR